MIKKGSLTDLGGEFCKPVLNGLYNEQLASVNLQLALKCDLIFPNSLKLRYLVFLVSKSAGRQSLSPPEVSGQ